MLTHSRQRTVQTCQEIWHSAPVFIDTETTGLDTRAEIIEISVVASDGAVLLDSLVRPQCSIPYASTRIHGITDSMVMNAPEWPEVWPLLLSCIAGRRVGVYNAEFDLRMLKQSNRLHQIHWDPAASQFFCVMEMYKRFAGAPRWLKLEVAARGCQIDLPNAHRAFADALLARAVFEYMAVWME